MSIYGKKIKSWETVTLAKIERLCQDEHWFPYPVLISVTMLAVLMAQVFPGLNQRNGNPASTMTYMTKPENDDGVVWFSLTPVGEDIVAITGNKKVFRWPATTTTAKDLKEFVRYLQGQLDDAILSSALLKDPHIADRALRIAVDQHLKYLHLRPVLYALAEVGITRYGFETKQPIKKVSQR